MKRIISTLIMVMLMVTSVSGIALAEDMSSSVKDKLTGIAGSDTSGLSEYNPDYLKLKTPEAGYRTFYKGWNNGKRATETISWSLWASDTWSDYWTLPSGGIFRDSDGNDVHIFTADEVIPEDDGDIYKFSKKIGTGWATGKYSLVAMNVPVDYDNNVAPIPDDEWPIDYITIYIKNLLAPSSIKATAGSRKVTLTFKKATGSTNTYIYRSTSKSGTYKLVGTSTGTKYVDKNLKKGKKYYYKLKSKRNKFGRGIVYSSFSGHKYATAK